jgi:hypothetical protein
VGDPGGGVQPHDEQRPVAVDHEAGQAVAGAVDQPPGVGVRGHHGAAEVEGRREALGHEAAEVDRVATEHPQGDGAVVAEAEAHDPAAVVEHLGEGASGAALE